MFSFEKSAKPSYLELDSDHNDFDAKNLCDNFIFCEHMAVAFSHTPRQIKCRRVVQSTTSSTSTGSEDQSDMNFSSLFQSWLDQTNRTDPATTSFLGVSSSSQQPFTSSSSVWSDTQVSILCVGLSLVGFQELDGFCSTTSSTSQTVYTSVKGSLESWLIAFLCLLIALLVLFVCVTVMFCFYQKRKHQSNLQIIRENMETV